MPVNFAAFVCKLGAEENDLDLQYANMIHLKLTDGNLHQKVAIIGNS